MLWMKHKYREGRRKGREKERKTFILKNKIYVLPPWISPSRFESFQTLFYFRSRKFIKVKIEGGGRGRGKRKKQLGTACHQAASDLWRMLPAWRMDPASSVEDRCWKVALSPWRRPGLFWNPQTKRKHNCVPVSRRWLKILRSPYAKQD